MAVDEAYEIQLVSLRTNESFLVRLDIASETLTGITLLEQTGLEPTKLRFVRHPETHALTVEALEGELSLDSQPIHTAVTVSDGVVLTIGTEQFRCHIQTARTPQPETTQETQVPSALTLIAMAGWSTITGSFRKHNEDALGIYEQDPISFYAIADGVGGAEAGEIVSEFVIKSYLRAIHQHREKNTDWLAIFRDVLTNVNHEVRSFARRLTEIEHRHVQSGSTLSGVLINGTIANIIHVGDSRIYLWRNGQLRQLTEDHLSLASNGSVSKTGEFRPNVLGRAIGKFDELHGDTFTEQLYNGDKLLLCSDGLYNRFNSDELTRLLPTMPPAKMAAYLCKTADERKSGDNISALIVEMKERTSAQQSNLSTFVTQSRAFLGFDPRWPVKMSVDNVLPAEIDRREITLPQPPETQTAKRRSFVPFLVTLILLLIVVLLVGWLWQQGYLATWLSQFVQPTKDSTPITNQSLFISVSIIALLSRLRGTALADTYFIQG